MLVNGNAFRTWCLRFGEIPILLCLYVGLIAFGRLGVPTCPIRWLTGKPCPTCGTTRSIGTILTGDFGQAWNLNPIGFIVVLAFAKRCAGLFGPEKLRRMLDCQAIELTMLAAFLAFGLAKVVGWL